MNRDDQAELKTNSSVDQGICAVLLMLAMTVSLLGLSQSGEQWLEDGPRYCNNGAMMRDWIASGQFLDPVGFAQKNYTQYPAHSVPYHPPGYAFMLGVWFSVVGMSYETVRVFAGLCFALSLCCFYGILRRQGIVPWVAFSATLVMASSPEIARWSRTAMSETPSMAFILAGSYCFVRSVESERKGWSWLAFVFALLAFFCRVSTAGVLPAWFLFLFVTKGLRRTLSPHLVIPAIMYLIIGVTWVKFASSYAMHEVRESLSENLSGFLTIENLAVWLQGLPGMVGWITLAGVLPGLFLAFRNRDARDFAWFWTFWFLGCYALQLVQSIHFESRYFIYSVPALCALAVGSLAMRQISRHYRIIAVAVVGAAVLLNMYTLYRLPRGLRGYQAVADQLAQQESPGNILVSSWFDTELIFRFRCLPQHHYRQLIRGDRVLAIRYAQYSGIESKPLAKSAEDVLEIVRNGRIRYIVTCQRSATTTSGIDDRKADEVLLHETVTANSDYFELIGEHTILYGFRFDREEKVLVWRFKGELPAGPSALPVVIPTAGMSLGT